MQQWLRHELRNELQTVGMSVDVLSIEEASDDAKATAVEKLRRSVRRMGELLSEADPVLDPSRRPVDQQA